MRALWALPFTFVAGIDGFTIFVPYVLLIMLVAIIIRRQQARKPTPVPIPIAVPTHIAAQPAV